MGLIGLLGSLHAVTLVALSSRGSLAWSYLEPLASFLYQSDANVTFAECAVKNFGTWIVLYTFAFVVLYTPPGKDHFANIKYNPQPPKNGLVPVEMARSAGGILVVTIYEFVLCQLYNEGVLPLKAMEEALPWSLESKDLASVPTASVLCWILPLYLWSDCHFYWTHRLLHTPMLFKAIHKTHHESYNPDPWSGLSMHPVEHLIYFSAALVTAIVAPLWVVRANVFGLIAFPLPGHSGHGDWQDESSCNHYLHHAKFKWNYGSSPMWDHLMGTNFPESKAGGGLTGATSGSPFTTDSAEAAEQAKLSGCDFVANKNSAPTEIASKKSK